MARSTPYLLAAGGITAGNELLHDNTAAALRVSVATLALMIVMGGVEQIPGGDALAVGLSVTALVVVIFGSVTPGVPSPAAQILALINRGSNQKG
jgi:hypothetical protein